jgi:Acetyltransferase (GNAT) domain
MNLRPAVPADLNLLQLWDEQPHVLAADPNDDWHWEIELDRTPDWREQLIAEIEGRPIGFIQIIDPARKDSHYWGEIAANLRAIDIWIGEESNLGKGYGTKTMQLALEGVMNFWDWLEWRYGKESIPHRCERPRVGICRSLFDLDERRCSTTRAQSARSLQ